MQITKDYENLTTNTGSGRKNEIEYENEKKYARIQRVYMRHELKLIWLAKTTINLAVNII